MFLPARRPWIALGVTAGLLGVVLIFAQHPIMGKAEGQDPPKPRKPVSTALKEELIKAYGAAVHRDQRPSLDAKLRELDKQGKSRNKAADSPFVREMILRGLRLSVEEGKGGVHRLAAGAEPLEAAAKEIDESDPKKLKELIIKGTNSLCGLQFPKSLRGADKELKSRVRRDHNRKSRMAFGAGQDVVDTRTAAPRGTASSDHFDFRTRNVISFANNQNPCGSCWAFASVGAFEAATAIFNTDGKLIKFSEQYVLDCTPPSDGLENSCNSGFWGDALDMMKGGVPWVDLSKGENDRFAYKFPSAKDPTNYPGMPPFADKRFRVQSWNYVDPDSEIPTPDQIKEKLCQYGPIIVGLQNSYEFGTTTDDVCDDESGNFSQNHAVVIVGWKDGYDSTDPSKGAWLIKNSWGSWGMNQSGFGYVDYKSNNIGMQATYVVVEPLN